MTPVELIAIGTSLGGLNALVTLLSGLPVLPLPVVVVQHRGTTPDRNGLAGLLQGETTWGVIEAEDKMPLERGRVYLAPADYHLLVESRGVLALSTEAPVLSARPSIDVFLESAADAYGAALLAVILTGASADGARGLAAVMARRGRGIVQDPATAECRTMPAAALAATAVDYVLPLPQIGEHLVALAEGTRA
jgi:two-component system chemotaxis response regulator CheB